MVDELLKSASSDESYEQRAEMTRTLSLAQASLELSRVDTSIVRIEQAAADHLDARRQNLVNGVVDGWTERDWQERKAAQNSIFTLLEFNHCNCDKDELEINSTLNCDYFFLFSLAFLKCF